MLYVSIDLETTGTHSARHQIIEFGAVIENTRKSTELENLPKFKRVIKHPEYTGQAFALNLNARIFAELASPTGITPICEPQELPEQFNNFLINNGFSTDEGKEYIRIIAAGKNFATFDLPFLNSLPTWRDHIRISHKILDPAMYFVNFAEDDHLPSLEECKKRAGFADVAVTHDALDDALDVVRLLRQQYK